MLILHYLSCLKWYKYLQKLVSSYFLFFLFLKGNVEMIFSFMGSHHFYSPNPKIKKEICMISILTIFLPFCTLHQKEGRKNVYKHFYMTQVSDVVPVACRAAADAGIRSVCVTNFRLPIFSFDSPKLNIYIYIIYIFSFLLFLLQSLACSYFLLQVNYTLKT